MNATLEILKKARELISDPSRWTQGTYARNSNGSQEFIMSPAAVCFCTIGAVRRVCGDKSYGHALFSLAARLPDPPLELSDFNDAPNRTHAEVLALFDKAIKAEEAKSPC